MKVARFKNQRKEKGEKRRKERQGEEKTEAGEKERRRRKKTNVKILKIATENIG